MNFSLGYCAFPWAYRRKLHAPRRALSLLSFAFAEDSSRAFGPRSTEASELVAFHLLLHEASERNEADGPRGIVIYYSYL